MKSKLVKVKFKGYVRRRKEKITGREREKIKRICGEVSKQMKEKKLIDMRKE